MLLTPLVVPKWQKYILIGAVISTVFIFAHIGRSALPPRFELGDEYMTISGAYGITVRYSDIESIELMETMPHVGFKSNELDLGPILKGYFYVEDMGSTRLFLRSSQPPVICVKFDSQAEPILINFPHPDETRNLYQSLKAKADEN